MSRQRRTRCAIGSKHIAGKDYVALTILVSSYDLRREFKRLRMLERFHAGEFNARIRDRRHTRFSAADPRHGWVSQIADWIDSRGRIVATVHQWLDDQGNPAASKLPDPKWVGESGMAFAFGDPSSKRVPQHDYQDVNGEALAELGTLWPHKDNSIPELAFRCANCGAYWVELRNRDGTRWHFEADSLEDFAVHAIKSINIETHPLTPDRWRDLAALFETSSTTRTCWCTWFRQTTADYRANAGDKNRRAFQRIVRTAKAPPGVLAYIDGKPAGWCAVAPREDYTRLARSKTLKPIDDEPVWSVTCFFIGSHARRRGVAHALLRAAVELAARHGATIVEGYPLVPGRKLRSDEAYVGVTPLFEKASFTEVARPSEGRAIMRYNVTKKRRP